MVYSNIFLTLNATLLPGASGAQIQNIYNICEVWKMWGAKRKSSNISIKLAKRTSTAPFLKLECSFKTMQRSDVCPGEITAQQRCFSHIQEILEISPPLWFLQLTLIHSNLAEEMREAISVYDELLSRLHFLCPSSSSCFSPQCLVLFEWDREDFPAAWTLCYWILAAEAPAADGPWVWHITYLQNYHISNSPCQLPRRLL